MGTAVCNWADLPIEILDEMLTKLSDIEDLIRFGAVSRLWRSASVESKKTNKNYGPWLMLSEPENPHNFLEGNTVMLITMFNQEEEEDSSFKNEDKHKDFLETRKFFNLLTNKTIQLYLPEAKGRRCFGSNFGWILTLGVDLNIHLLNPLTRLRISLPPQATFQNQYGEPIFEESGQVEPEYLRTIFLQKFALSSHPNHDPNQQKNVVVMVIYSQDRILAMARPGDRAWTNVECPGGWYEDVIFYNNVFYAVYYGGDVVVCDITKPVPEATAFMPPPTLCLMQSYRHRHYLVEMSGHLHLVVRIYYNDEENMFTTEFKVYKLDFCQKEWIQLQDLGDHALFIGNNASFALNHPQLRSNCIYFSDDHMEYYYEDYCDMGLFDFGEKKIVDPICSGDFVLSTFCRPLFFIPNLY